MEWQTENKSPRSYLEYKPMKKFTIRKDRDKWWVINQPELNLIQFDNFEEARFYCWIHGARRV